HAEGLREEGALRAAGERAEEVPRAAGRVLLRNGEGRGTGAGRLRARGVGDPGLDAELVRRIGVPVTVASRRPGEDRDPAVSEDATGQADVGHVRPIPIP